MKTCLITAMLFTVSASLGCTSTATRNLQQESAQAICAGWTPDQVKVSDVKRNGMSLSWTAKTPGGKYSCSSDDPARGVVCTK